MQLTLDAIWLTATLLVATRLAGLLVLSPVLGFASIPASVRVLFVLSLALVMVLSIQLRLVRQLNSIPALVAAMATEFLVGAVIGFAVFAVFAALSLAGQLLDFQIGFNAAALFDVNTQAQNPLLSAFFGLLGGLLFLVMDAHLELIRAVAASFEIFPLGRIGMPLDVSGIVRQFGNVFLYGVAIAGPVLLGILLLDVSIAVVARTLPQINVYFVTLPLKIFVGLLLLAMSLTQMGPVVRSLFATTSLPVSASGN